jgi:thymidylate synthase
MINTFTYKTASHALPQLMETVLSGQEIGSRVGKTREILFPHITLTEPWRREILHPDRRASLTAQIAETMWLLAGRDDVAWLQNYLPRAADYSDDGTVWRGAYGRRLRSWDRRDHGDVLDQLSWVVDHLTADPASRRAVLTIWDPDRDTTAGKDIPCNNWLHFLVRGGKLHLHVSIRSNDLMWGWSGINAFEWSAVQEIVAGMIGMKVGSLEFSTSSLHLYDRHWERAHRIATNRVKPEVFPVASPRFDASGLDRFEDLDYLLRDWFELEEAIRNPRGLGGTQQAWLRRQVDAFDEPMMQSWLRVIGWHWSGDDEWLAPLNGTPLAAAAWMSPPRVAPEPEPEPQPEPEPPKADPFTEFVVKLHAEKHAAYGDSWKRRGEQIGILANIARKVDRLGVAGGGDTSADTVIDLLVYLIKYRLWLREQYALVGTLSDNPLYVANELRSLPRDVANATTAPKAIQELKAAFDALEQTVERGQPYSSREQLVQQMIPVAAVAARFYWLNEQGLDRSEQLLQYVRKLESGAGE